MPSNTLILPQLTATLSSPLSSQLLLAAGGRAPADIWFSQVSQGRRLWAIDHGVDVCQKNQLPPERLIGDADSASPAAWEWAAAAGIPVDRFPPAKDFTDTQLALQKAAELFPDAFLLLTGAFGGRFDHTLSTVLSLSGTQLHGCLCDEQEVLFPLKEKETITLRLTRAPKAVSLLPLTSECQGVTISGVRWPLHDVVLRQLEPYAVSNELSGGATITVKVHTGILGVYLFWETA